MSTLSTWNTAYYNEQPLVDDATYDKLYHQVLEYEQEHPEHKIVGVTSRVGTPVQVTSGTTVSTHLHRMWSMEDIFNLEELKKWCSKRPGPWVVEPKFDGCSCNLLYKHGILSSASTRGDGSVGELVSYNLPFISGFPYKLVDTGGIEKLEVRGEILISKHDFHRINRDLEDQGLAKYANPRNLTSGTIRNSDAEVVKYRRMVFIPWGVGDITELGLKNHSELRNWFFSNKFLIDSKLDLVEPKVVHTVEELEELYQYYISIRSKLPYELDGMVIRVNDIQSGLEYGYSAKYPNYMVAYKFPADVAITELLGIEWNVGRTGVVTPVALLEPVSLAGTTVARATLHNPNEIRRLELQLGSKIQLIKSGDIIPKILAKVSDGTGSPIDIPTVCPSCSSTLDDVNGTLYCRNSVCPSVVLSKLEYYCELIDGVSIATIRDLLDHKFIRGNNYLQLIKSLYSVDPEELAMLDGYDTTSASAIYTAISSSIRCPLDKFLTALGIPSISSVTSKTLVDKYGLDWYNIDPSGIEFLNKQQIENLAKFIQTYRSDILELQNLVAPTVPVRAGKLLGKSIAITGTFDLPRSDIIKFIESNGGIYMSSVSKKCTDILVGDSAGSKEQKAMKLGLNKLTLADIQG